MNSQACPLDEQLRALLDEQVVDLVVRDELERHIEGCLMCQQKLDGWLAADAMADPGHSTNFNADETLERLIDELASQIPLGNRAAVPLICSGTMFGVYRLLEPIGEGTSGVVYRAEDTRLKRPVAIKVLRNDFAESERSRARLEREARAAAGLDHENVARVYDVRIDPVGVSYLVLEFVPGQTLRELIRQRGALAPRLAAELAQQILRGLFAAHRKGLVHRDLKSCNVLLQSVGDAPKSVAAKRESSNDLTAKLIDFGLVRDLENDSHLTRENVVAGTPAYMSPEQVLTPHDVDHRADIFSLGVVLYEMLTGEVPFRGVERMVLQQVIHDDPLSLCRQNDLINRDLETICFKAMSKSPDLRYQSALDMQEDLGRWLSGLPIQARRVSRLSKAWSWSRRNRALATSLALSLGLLLTIAIGATIAAISIRSSSIENQRLAKVAELQRDQSLETIRKLIFDVNELLEPEIEADVDETQMKLLMVALQGLEQIEQTGDDANLIDVSSVAAKNRLGDVYFRLDRLEEAKFQFEQALQRAEKIVPNKTALDGLLNEQLRSYEGLAAYALEQDDDEAWQSNSKKVAELTTRLTELRGELVDSIYLPENNRLADKQVKILQRRLAESVSQPPTYIAEIKSVVEVAQSLAWHYCEIGELVEAKTIIGELENWLSKSPAQKTNPKFIREIAFAHHVVSFELAELCDSDNPADDRLKYLRAAIDCLPRGASKFQIHSAAPDSAYEALAQLLKLCEQRTPEPWMADYFRIDVGLAKMDWDDFPTRRELESEFYVATLKLIRILKMSGDVDAAESEWTQIREAVQKFSRHSTGEPDEFSLATLDAVQQAGFKIEK